MDLNEIRKDIDEIDKKLLPLFAERMNLCLKVAEYKIANNMPVFNKEREDKILDKVYEEAEEFKDETRLFFSSVMGISRSLQHQKCASKGEFLHFLEDQTKKMLSDERMNDTKGVTVAVPGIKCSNSHEAALTMFPDGEFKFYETFDLALEALDKGETRYCVLPAENSTAGSVQKAYELIMKYKFYIAKSTTLYLSHCLAAPQGAYLEGIKKVYSHPHALAQCSTFLKDHGAKLVEYTNTATAAELIARENDLTKAAICSETAAKEYGLVVLKNNLQDKKNNRTRFLSLTKNCIIAENANKISISFGLPHITGSLYEVLARFASGNMNLTKIESRPAVNQDDLSQFEYDFYLDFLGNIKDSKTRNLLAELHDEMESFSFLGNYID